MKTAEFLHVQDFPRSICDIVVVYHCITTCYSPDVPVSG